MPVKYAPTPGMPFTTRVRPTTSHSTIPSTTPTAMPATGPSTTAQRALDSTTWASEIGSDFQNSTLRSRRSS